LATTTHGTQVTCQTRAQKDTTLRVGICISIHSRTVSIFLKPVARHYSAVHNHTLPSPVYLSKSSISVMYHCFERSLLQ
ncbi:hypothetical protein KCU65_g157, partial [Aureobasidium melanogenum]